MGPYSNFEDMEFNSTFKKKKKKKRLALSHVISSKTNILWQISNKAKGVVWPWARGPWTA